MASTIDFIRFRIDEHFTAEVVLEYGCGPGRLAIPFARRAGRVVAVDRSEAMLASARKFASEWGIANISFQTSDEFLAHEETFNLVNCHLMLQRVSTTEGLNIIRALLKRVGEIGVFQLPYRDRSSAASRSSRWLRSHSRLANGFANALLRRPLTTQFIPTTVYDLSDVLGVFAEEGYETLHVTTACHGELDTATFFVRRRGSLRTPTMRPPSTDSQRSIESHIDVEQLMAQTSIEEWNRRAEEYFAGLTNWDHHLSKPFNTPDETPALLINLAVLIQGLRLIPGQTVLEFGAGTGWLSRMLTQLGCRVILLDVSESALRIAKATYDRIAIIGDRPAPSFLLFDGRTIELPDGSVDRIVSFDAFHHAPNPADVLSEFGRVLAPGGVAGFVEPGPNHSQTAQSQFEMRTYGVLENNIHLPALWRAAQYAGFTDVKVAALNIPPFHLSLSEYDDFLQGGATSARWADRTREFLRDVRNFFLIKGSGEAPDSRRAAGLRANITIGKFEQPVAHQPFRFHAEVTNIGTATWLPSTEAAGGVWLGCHLYDANGTLRDLEYGQFPISPTSLGPDQSSEVTGELRGLPAGEYRIEFDCVAAHVTWLAQVGSRTANLTIVVESLS
ncbi:MAG: methyltransferase domain-containing protein [Thermoanaerobaculia bacterium]|nr:methyltransferase domain-containing protein [Thermoanaerobaculia bacterium]